MNEEIGVFEIKQKAEAVRKGDPKQEFFSAAMVFLDGQREEVIRHDHEGKEAQERSAGFVIKEEGESDDVQFSPSVFLDERGIEDEEYAEDCEE